MTSKSDWFHNIIFQLPQLVAKTSARHTEQHLFEAVCNLGTTGFSGHFLWKVLLLWI